MIHGLIVLIEIIICYLLQSTVFSMIPSLAASPDLLIIIVAANAYCYGRFKGMYTGFAAGLIMDLCEGSVIGVFTLIYLLIGYVCGFSKKIYDKDDITVSVILIACSEILYCLLYFIFYIVIAGNGDFIYCLKSIFIPRIILTVICSFILYKPLNFVNYSFSSYKKRED